MNVDDFEREKAIIRRGWELFDATQDLLAAFGMALDGELRRQEIEAMPHADQARFFTAYVANLESTLKPVTFDEASETLPTNFYKPLPDPIEQYPQRNRHERRKARALVRKAIR